MDHVNVREAEGIPTSTEEKSTPAENDTKKDGNGKLPVGIFEYDKKSYILKIRGPQKKHCRINLSEFMRKPKVIVASHESESLTTISACGPINTEAEELNIDIAVENAVADQLTFLKGQHISSILYELKLSDKLKELRLSSKIVVQSQSQNVELQSNNPVSEIMEKGDLSDSYVVRPRNPAHELKNKLLTIVSSNDEEEYIAFKNNTSVITNEPIIEILTEVLSNSKLEDEVDSNVNFKNNWFNFYL